MEITQRPSQGTVLLHDWNQSQEELLKQRTVGGNLFMKQRKSSYEVLGTRSLAEKNGSSLKIQQ